MKSSPFLINPKKLSTRQIMWRVNLLVIPIIISMSVFFGIGIILNVIYSLFFCLLIEYFYLKLVYDNHKAIHHIFDGSAATSALLFAICLPPFVAPWVIFVASLVIILIAKQLYGGLGNNIFNPAMVGYLFVLISFPTYITIWPASNMDIDWLKNLVELLNPNFNHTIDAISSSTPLSIINYDLNDLKNINPLSQATWLLINLVSLVCGLILLFLGLIRWHLPLSFLLSFSLINLIYLIVLDLPINFLAIELFGGATMIAAFFIITDPVSAATTNKGRIIQGICFALLLFAIRSLSSSYPEGVAFATILCNLINPIIDKISKPKRYGY